MRTEPILIIELNQPDPRKRGQAYGEAARESIHSILDKYREILSDHMDRPFSICSHENPAVAPLQQVVTCLSIIMNLSRKQVHYTLGNPCRGEVQTLELGW